MDLVRKRDGRLEPFDLSKLARSLAAAMDAQQGSEPEREALARELGRSIHHALTRAGSDWRAAGPLLTSQEIAEASLRALTDTGHAEVAQRLEARARWRGQHRDALRVSVDATLTVVSEDGERPWTKQRVIDALTREAQLAAPLAADLARSVEARVFAAGLRRISSELLRAIVDAELSERGFGARLGGSRRAGPTQAELRQRLNEGQGRDPAALEASLAADSLRGFALDEMLPAGAALALRHGAIALAGLERPLSLWSYELEDAREAAPLLREARAIAPRLGGALIVSGPCLEAPPALLREALPAPAWARLERPPEGAGWAGPAVIELTRGVVPESLAERLARWPAGAPRVLVVSEGPPRAPRHPWRLGGQAGVDLALINLARCALLAGRGERERFSAALEARVDEALDALLARRDWLIGMVLEPDMPLWQAAAAGPELGGRLCEPGALAAGVSPAGLEAALAYLTGEGITENARVERLAGDILRELRGLVRKGARRRGLVAELVDAREAGLDDQGRAFARADLLAFPQAEELRARPEAYAVGLPRVEGAARRRLGRALGAPTCWEMSSLSEDPSWGSWLLGR